MDLLLKRDRYERAGVGSYWVVDPDEPRLVAWELRSGRYEQVADVAGEQSWTSTHPLVVTLTPALLRK